MKKLLSLILTLLFIAVCLVSAFSYSIDADTNESEIQIIFTHDLHSHVQPFLFNGKYVGGFARVKTVIDDLKSRSDVSVVLDGGDFSMGTLYQTVFTSAAVEYSLLGEMGYDAICFGNHEFDYGFDALLEMIGAAKSVSTSLPPILTSNIDTENSKYDYSQLEEYNVKEYTIIKKGDYSIAVFGLMGASASDYTCEDIAFFDASDRAKEIVDEINRIHNPDMIICLSHTGTGDGAKDEDLKIAKEVPEIDVIISAHSHTTLNEPISVGNTLVVSSGEYGKYVGSLKVNIEDNSLISYDLIEVNDSIKSDASITDRISKYETNISEYLKHFGFDYSSDIIAKSDFEFPEQENMYDQVAEQQLGNLISDAFRYAIKTAEGDSYVPIDVAVAPLGCIRTSIDKGDITVSQIFEMLSLGSGPDGYAGYPLCSVYLYGSELWTIAEIDASVSGIMSAAQLYSSGLCYSVNTNRMLFNRVYECWLEDENGNRIEIIEDKLYRVVSCLEAVEMLGSVKDKSFGLLSLEPKNAKGEPIIDFDKTVVSSPEGYEIKEWVSVAQYLSSFDKKEGIPTIDNKYMHLMDRKNVSNKIKLKEIFYKWNYITWIVFFIVNLLLAGIVLLIVFIVKKIKKKRKAKELRKIST